MSHFYTCAYQNIQHPNAFLKNSKSKFWIIFCIIYVFVIVFTLLPFGAFILPGKMACFSTKVVKIVVSYLVILSTFLTTFVDEQAKRPSLNWVNYFATRGLLIRSFSSQIVFVFANVEAVLKFFTEIGNQFSNKTC